MSLARGKYSVTLPVTMISTYHQELMLAKGVYLKQALSRTWLACFHLALSSPKKGTA